MPSLIILDRDGVINEDSDDFIKSPEEWTPIEGSLEAIALLTKNDYKIAIASNQSGIARELFDIETLNDIHQKMLDHIHQAGGQIEGIFFCPHGPDDGCECRKPKPGLFNEIAQRLHFPLNDVPSIGDSLRDLQAAEAVNAKPILVMTGKGKNTLKENPELKTRYPVYPDLLHAVAALLADHE